MSSGSYLGRYHEGINYNQTCHVSREVAVVAVSEVQQHSVQPPGRPSRPARIIRATAHHGLDVTWAWPSESSPPTVPPKVPNYPAQRQAERGRCSGPQDHLPVGAQVSMSQRGPASRPASPRSTRSPTSSHPISPETVRSGLQNAGNPPSDDGSQESGSLSSLYGDRPQSIQRSFGVHNILNPQDTNTGTNISAPTAIQAGNGHGSSVSLYGTQIGPRLPTQRPQLFQGHGVQGDNTERRFSDEPGAAGTPPGRWDSPGAAHPWSVPGGPRRFITPRSPRASSMSFSSQARLGVQAAQHPVSSMAERGRNPSGGTSGERSFHGHPAQPLVQPLSGVALPGILTSGGSGPNLNSTARSSSQPMVGQAQEPPVRQSEASSQQQRAPVFPSPSPYTTSMPPAVRGLPAAALADPRWPPVLAAQQGLRGPGLSEEHSTLMFATPGGEPVEFVVDTTNASRHADEKRLRNAGASARFRQRKKDKDHQKDSAIEKLEAQNRELERRIRDLESERERYRVDRDRLRDVVHRTPSISDLAYQGPRSPPLRRIGSFAGNTPFAGAAPGPPLTSDTYGTGNPFTGERPARRRRTESQTEFSPATYTPALPPPNYSTPTSQSGPPSVGGRLERLAPMRLDMPSGMPVASGLSSAGPPTQGFPHLKREPYESGWATKHSGPPDPGLR